MCRLTKRPIYKETTTNIQKDPNTHKSKNQKTNIQIDKHMNIKTSKKYLTAQVHLYIANNEKDGFAALRRSLHGQIDLNMNR